MLSESTYRAAHIVAIEVENVLLDHVKEASKIHTEHLASVPNASVIENIIDVAFWSSLRKEEGQPAKLSLAYVHPDQVHQPIIFSNSLALDPITLAKVAPGFERAGIYLGVWFDGTEIKVWGAANNIPNYCLVLDVSEPGCVVIKHRKSTDFGKFTNIAVLTGSEIKILKHTHADMDEYPEVIRKMLDFSPANSIKRSLNVMLQISVSMRAHHKGGILLVVPEGTDGWKKSIRLPLQHELKPSFKGIPDLLRQEIENDGGISWQRAITREIEMLAGLTAIDGAVLMNNAYELLAFGEKIKRADSVSPIETILYSEPIFGAEARNINPAQGGGTRHLSAAQFVSDQKNAIALVASQDGRFTVFSWSDKHQLVMAHRIDTLLI